MEDTLGKIKRYVGESHYLDTVLILATLVHLEGHKNYPNLQLATIFTKPNLSHKDISQALKQIEVQVSELKSVFKYITFPERISSDDLKNSISLMKKVIYETDDRNEWLTSLLYEEGTTSYKNPASTPTNLNQLVIQLLNPTKGSFYDGTAGFGGTLVELSEYSKVNNNNIDIYGQEINDYNWAVSKIRLFLMGIQSEHIRKGDSLSDPVHHANGKLKTFDYAFVDGPFGLPIQNYEMVKKNPFNQYHLGIPTRKAGDMALLMHLISSLNSNGKGIITMTDGALFRGGNEEVIRQKMLEADFIEAIISLPTKLYTPTAVPTNLVFINKAKKISRKGKILFINAERLFEELHKGKRILPENQVENIVNVFRKGRELEGFSKFIEISSINDALLVAHKYLLSNKFTLPNFGEVEINLSSLEELETAPLSKWATFFSGYNVVSKNKESGSGNFQVIKISDVHDGIIDFDCVAHYDIDSKVQTDKYTLQKNDVILSIRGQAIKVAVMPGNRKNVLLSQNFIGIRCHGELNPHYLKAYLESPLGQCQLTSKLSGTTISTLSKRDVELLSIPMKPLKVQESMMQVYIEQKKYIEQKIKRHKQEIQSNKEKLYIEMGIANTFLITKINRES